MQVEAERDEIIERVAALDVRFPRSRGGISYKG
jgi:hypothetical protein